jgi:hypothetical protein
METNPSQAIGAADAVAQGIRKIKSYQNNIAIWHVTSYRRRVSRSRTNGVNTDGPKRNTAFDRLWNKVCSGTWVETKHVFKGYHKVPLSNDVTFAVAPLALTPCVPFPPPGLPTYGRFTRQDSACRDPPKPTPDRLRVAERARHAKGRPRPCPSPGVFSPDVRKYRKGARKSQRIY